MQSEYRHGALTVIEYVREKDSLQQELRLIDDRLFLERQLTLVGEPVWCVVVNVGGDVPPITILEWRDDDDNPLPLSSGILERMRRMDRDGARLAARVIKQNRDRIEAARQKAKDDWEEIGKDVGGRMSGTRSAVLHRGQYLRRSRDKRRARGEKL